MSPIKRFLCILALTCMWSPSFLFIKLAVADLPPFTIVSLRTLLAGLIIFCLLMLRGGTMPSHWRFWAHSTIMAFFSSAFPFVLFCYGEQTIDSALAAMINGTTPMFTALIAHRFVASDSLNSQKIIGITLGMAGVVSLCAPNALLGTAHILGILAIACAALSYAISHVYAKKYITGQAPFVAPTAQLLLAGLMIMPLSLWFDAPWTLAMPSMPAILGVLGLTLLGTVFAFILYYKLMETCGPTAVSMSACLFPVGGMILGALVLGETLTPTALMAAVLIISGMLIVNDVVKVPGLVRTAEMDRA